MKAILTGLALCCMLPAALSAAEQHPLTPPDPKTHYESARAPADGGLHELILAPATGRPRPRGCASA